MKNLKKLIIASIALTSFNAFSEVSVIVNTSNANSVDQSVIKKIFLGKSKTFPDGNKIIVYTLKDSNADAVDFRQNALKKSNSQYKSYWAKLAFTGKGTPPKEADDNEMINAIKNNPNAIGFINSSKVTADVKVIATF